MKMILCVLMMSAFVIVNGQENFQLERPLPKSLKEISGTVKDDDVLWAITDANGSIYKLDLQGQVLQEVKLSGLHLTDVEAIAADRKYLYIGDIGDNDGTRADRIIIRIPKSSITKGTTTVSGDQIRFTFAGEGTVKKKKSNNYDCEAMVSYGDSLYLFTKERDDMGTSLYVLSKTPGKYEARNIDHFKTKGLVTDAAVNERGNEISLIGYDEGHRRPFVWTFTDFNGSNFFTGKHKRYELTHKKNLDWQVESISYRDASSFFISCEKTKDVPNTLYVIPKSDLLHSDKGD
jgi:hypothetical protein